MLQDIGKLAQEVNKDNANTFVSIDKLFPKASVVIPSEHGDLIIVDADLEENELSQ